MAGGDGEGERQEVLARLYGLGLGKPLTQTQAHFSTTVRATAAAPRCVRRPQAQTPAAQPG